MLNASSKPVRVGQRSARDECRREEPHGDAGFFFQAEDGIRDLTVTGVQTCALPISTVHKPSASRANKLNKRIDLAHRRSEEHTSDSSHSQISYAVFCLKKKKK